MTQTNLARRVISEALKSSGISARAFHSEVATKKCLYNSESLTSLETGSVGKSRAMVIAGTRPDILNQVAILQGPVNVADNVSRFNQLENKPDLKAEWKMVKEIHTEPQKLSKMEHKSEDMSESCDIQPRMFMDQERPLVPIMPKRSQVKTDKETKENRGFSEVTGNVSPAVHFKNPNVGLRSKGLLDSLTSGHLVSFYKKRLNESRNFSTLKNVRNDGFDGLKPVPLMLQREIASHCRNRIVDKKVIAHSLSTSSKCYARDDPCLPPTLPPKDLSCDPRDKLQRCDKKPDWQPCCPSRICLCGCEKPHPRSLLINCGRGEYYPFLDFAKRPEYICPSFSECSLKVSLNKKVLTECCYPKKTCDSFVGPLKPFVTAMERQEMILGQKYWSGQKQPCAHFHSSARLLMTGGKFNKNLWSPQQMQRAAFHQSSRLMAEEECDRPNKGQLPCQRTVNIPGVRKKEKAQGKGSCEKLCMPCCEPARDPPECLSIYQKAPCSKLKNPRPAFSECRKRFPFKHTMCECEVPNKPRCDQKKKNQESTC